MAKRGVMAIWLRPLPCQSDMTCRVGCSLYLRRVQQCPEGVVIHHHLTADHAHVASHRLGEEGIGRRLMDGAVGDRRRRAVTNELVVEMRGDLLRVGAFHKRHSSGKV